MQTITITVLVATLLALGVIGCSSSTSPAATVDSGASDTAVVPDTGSPADAAVDARGDAGSARLRASSGGIGRVVGVVN